MSKRKLWMASRNIRAIPPWKLIQILDAFFQASKNADWDHSVKSLLEKQGLKRNFQSYDSNPGGDRTYLAQLICLGFIYKDSAGEIQFTKAGRDYLNDHPEPLIILRSLLLRQQYPSVYSTGTGVNISEDVKVRPLLFILELLLLLEEKNDPEKFLRDEEIAIAVIYGQNHSMLDKCLQKILKMRNGEKISAQIDDVDDLWTSKTHSKSTPDKIKNILSISNTFANWLESAQLTIRSKVGTKKVSALNHQNLELIRRIQREPLICDTRACVDKNPISFQRQFGAWDGAKDTSPPNSAGIQPLKVEEQLIKHKFIELLSEKILNESDILIFKTQMSQLGFDAAAVEKIIVKYSNMNTSIYEDTYIKLSTGGPSQGRAFEIATQQLLQKIGVDAISTGQISRKGEGRGGYADILVSYQGAALLIDTKASDKYTITSDDHAKACSNYIPNWSELRTMHNKTAAEQLAGFCYIAGGFYPLNSIEGKLAEIKKETGVNASAISAWALLKYVQKNKAASPQDFFERVSRDGLIELN